MAELEDEIGKDSEHRDSEQDSEQAESGAVTAAARPQATQALFRPDFDDEDDLPILSTGDADTESQERISVATRVLPPVRHLGGGLVEIARVRDIDPLEALMTNPVVPEY